MTRQDFLENHWKPYPAWPLPASQGSSWLCGKIAEVAGPQLTLQGGAPLQPAAAPVHQVLGAPLPLNLAIPGDCVGLLKTGSGIAGPYLLSPNLLAEQAPLRNEDWQNFLESVRQFFVARGFRQWATPYLVESSGVDAHIDFMTVAGIRTGRTYFLPTSPEFELKKALASGEERVFEIKSCFRDDDMTPIHRSEFKMLEWYRAYEDKWSLLDDFEALVAVLAPIYGFKGTLQPERVSMAQLFERHVGMTLTPQTSRAELQNALKARHQHFTNNDDWDDLFFRLYIEFVEPHLGHDHPVAVYDFPAGQCSLAKQTVDGWADRFEIYWKGVELANAYQEQNNPYLVAETVTREIDKRRQLGRIPHNSDNSFIAAMRSGFPPCAGAALGLDRLLMVLRNASKLF